MLADMNLAAVRALKPGQNSEKPLETQPVLSARGVTKIYRSSAGPFSALQDAAIDLYPGEWVGVIGKSGAGKSTLVNMLTGVDALSAGEIWFGATPVHALSEDQKALWRGRSVGVVYQTFQLMPTLTLLDNLLLPMEFCGLYRRGESEIRAMDLLRAVELDAHAHKRPSAISGGQQQRAAIARALANDPPLIIADEPTGNLDSHTAETIFQLFDRLVKQGKTVFMVSHDRSLAERVGRLFTITDGVLAPAETRKK
jgi:putative ABC transport system ATP-binding protein